ncbi:excinuclease ATPase subunit [Roseateles oligotrophus]|uniref:Excinuclease ATPase subunit n=1 Tax=Roseateles oligotrophus TaxID=1769250 RepID=A0ABT2YDG4_9BURK|nr:excinuclease ATPase subunit [Roseateles oligotrophus]MCV2368085.1 excinuclease ATPase subunit [Roseateles oligotrophus]
MSKFLIAAVFLASLTPLAQARDTVLNIPLADVLAMPEAQGKLDGSVKFFLAGQQTPKVIKTFSSDVSNPKTNGFGKTDEFGCKWAALSALIAFQKSAKREGANAVVDLVSYYKKNETKSDTTFECHAGAMIIGVALKGTYATVGE